MPRIFLKPNSAEFDHTTQQAKSGPQRCDMPGCTHQGEHRAPRDRSLREYYNFCLDHVREYNKAWNFFQGMSDQEAQEHMINSLYGDRPTRRYDQPGMGEALRRKAWQTYHFTEEEPPQDSRHFSKEQRSTPEFEALEIMGLAPPVTLEAIKTRYKELVKKHHPDVNRNDKKSEELLKSVNMAYTILKLNYQKFSVLSEENL